MLTLTGQCIRVTAKPSREDSNVPEFHAHIQHTTSNDENADVGIEKLKLKSEAQVKAFRAAVGKNIHVPVRVWFQGANSGFWLENGVLPMVASTGA